MKSNNWMDKIDNDKYRLTYIPEPITFTNCMGWTDLITFNKEFKIKKVIFNNPATIVYWEDGTKTVIKVQEGDVYDKEKGLALCFAKKACGNTGKYNNIIKKWCE
jgi:hypothetical protein